MAMRKRGNKVRNEISILERLQSIRAMLVEVRESLGDNSPIEYEAPIEAVTELIADVEVEAKAKVVQQVTTVEPAEEPVAEEPKAEPEPRRRGRPRKVEPTEEQPADDTQSASRRKPKRKKEEHKELFPFYEQSLF